MNPDKKFYSSRFTDTGIPSPRTNVEIPAYLRRAQAGGREPLPPGPGVDPTDPNVPAYMRQRATTKMPVAGARPSERNIPQGTTDPANIATPAYMRRGQKPIEEARLIGQYDHGNRAVKIFRVWNEYIVRFYLNNKYEEKADYYTDDKADAVDTAKHWLRSGGNDDDSGPLKVTESLMHRVVKNLVRIQDIFENKKIYGGISTEDKKIIKSSIIESMGNGLAFEDAVLSMIEGFKEEIGEVAPIGAIPGIAAPGQLPNPAQANIAPPGGTGQPVASQGAVGVAKPGGTVKPVGTPVAGTTVPGQPVSSQGVDALAQMLGRAGLSPAQLSSLASKAKQQGQG